MEATDSKPLMRPNAVLKQEQWPAFRSEDFAPLPGRFRRLRKGVILCIGLALSLALSSVFVIAAWTSDAFEMPWMALSLVVGIIIAGGAIGLGVERKSFPRRGYLVREHDITFRKGWLFRSRVTVPFNRVQHSEVVQGPLLRWKGLSTLKVYTAGSSGANLSISGLDEEVAQMLRQTINERIRD